MPHTRASHETSQSTSQSLEVADILAMQHKAKGLAQAQHKGKKGLNPCQQLANHQVVVNLQVMKLHLRKPTH